MGEDVYLNTVARLEPEVAMIDPGAFYASAAISLKRIADSLERIEKELSGSPHKMGLIDSLHTLIG